MPGKLSNKRVDHWIWSVAVVFISTTSGCTICCQPYLDDYVTYGTRTPRSDMTHGRVGSPFSDPNLQGVTGEEAGAYYEQLPESTVIREEGESVSLDSGY